jgi:adenylate cyclase
VERRLAAILAADVVGYSRLIGQDEVGTLARLKAIRREIIDPQVQAHGGRVINTSGDAILIEFPSAVAAVECAVTVQSTMAERAQSEAPEKRIEFRVGINVGDVVVEEGNLLGDGVNVAARLEGIAEPGGICISARVQEDASGKLDLAVEDLGEQALKNIARPVRVYRVRIGRGPFSSMPRPVLPLPDKPSIAVLPFTNMSGDAEQEYFADGVVEDIITALSRVKWLFVIARNSSFTYKGRTVDLKQVGRELGVRYVLEGSIRRAGNRVRITGQLIDAASGAHVWAERYDRDLTDIFALQDEITASVVGAIEPRLRTAEIERAKRKPPESLNAYDLYLRALPHYHALRPEDHEKALDLLHRALEQEPEYQAALTLVALCYLMKVSQGWSEAPDADRANTIRYSEAALRLDPSDPEATAAAAQCLAFSGRRWPDALALADRAVTLNPNSAYCWDRSGWVRTYVGHSEMAVEHFERAARLSPLDPTAYHRLSGEAIALLQLRRFDQAVAAASEALRLNPAYTTPFRPLAAALAHMGRLDEAQAVAHRLLQVEPSFTISAWSNRTGITEEAKAELVEGMRRAGLSE